MRRDDVLALLGARREELQAYGVKSLALFGSVARGEEREGSDVDLLVEFEGPATFDRYMTLKSLLEGLLGRSVDLVTRRALKPRLRVAVEKEAVYVS